MELKNIARRGQAMVFYALVTPLLILFVGGVLDLGWYYLNVSRLQNAADAAALAGAQAIVDENNNFNNYYIVALSGNQLPSDFDNYENVFSNTFQGNTLKKGTLKKYKKADDEGLTKTLQDGRDFVEEYARKNLFDDAPVNTSAEDLNSVTVTDGWASAKADRTVTGTVELKYKKDDATKDVYGPLYYVVTLEEKVRHFFLPGWFDDMDAPVRAVVLLRPHDTDLVATIQNLEREMVITNWEYTNANRGNDGFYSGKWNHYQASTYNDREHGIKYANGNPNRTETVRISTRPRSKDSNSDGQDKTDANGPNGGTFYLEDVDSINIDMRAEVEKQFSTDWDIGQNMTGLKYQFMEGWSANDGADKRILYNVEFNEKFTTRSNFLEENPAKKADPLWVRIENDPIIIQIKKSGGKVGNYNSVRQITLNFNDDNTAIENGHYKYRPYFIYYTGPENIDYTVDLNGVLIRHSQPVVVNLNEDLNAIMYLPESPVIINGNGHAWHGFIVAKCFLKSVTEEDIMGGGYFWHYDGFNAPAKFRGGYSRSTDGNGNTVYFKPDTLKPDTEINLEALKTKYPDAEVTKNETSGDFMVTEEAQAPKRILLEYTKADHTEYAVTDEDGKHNEAKTFAAYINATYKEKFKTFKGLTDSQITAVTFPDENYNETTATYYVATKDKYGDNILLDTDPDPNAAPKDDQYVKVKVKVDDEDNYIDKYIDKKNLPYVKVRTDKEYFYVSVYDLKLTASGGKGVRMIDNSYTDDELNSAYRTETHKGSDGKNYTASINDIGDVYVNYDNNYYDSWAIDRTWYNDQRNNWKKGKLTFGEKNGVKYFMLNSDIAALPKEPQVIAKYHKITVDGADMYAKEGEKLYYTKVYNNDKNHDNYIIVDEKGNILTKPITAPELFTTPNVNTETVNDNFKKKVESIFSRASDAMLIDYWRNYTRDPKVPPENSEDLREQPYDEGQVNTSGRYIGQDKKRKDMDYRIPAFERVYYKSVFNLREDSYYSYFDIDYESENKDNMTLKRVNYEYLNVDEISHLIKEPPDPLADWAVDDMFFTKIRADWID